MEMSRARNEDGLPLILGFFVAITIVAMRLRFVAFRCALGEVVCKCSLIEVG